MILTSIHWKAGSRLWLRGKANNPSEERTVIALEPGNSQEMDSVRVRTADGEEIIASKRSVWMVRYTLAPSTNQP